MNNPLAKLKKTGPGALLQSPALPFILLWAFMTVCHLLFVMNTGDDPGHAMILREQNLFTFTIKNYQSWSSRSLVDIPNLVLNYLPNLVWQILNPLVIAGLGWGMAALAGLRKNAGACWSICGFLVLYPWQVLDSAGWITTTTVFLWPCAAAVGCLRVLQRTLLQEETNPPIWQQILAAMGFLYAANNEQVLVILLPLLAALCIAAIIQKQKIPALLRAGLGASAANLLYIALCPGNALRLESETVSWMPDIAMKGLLSKVELGASAALGEVFYSRSTLFFFFLVLLAWAVFRQRREWYFRLVALIPPAVCFLFGLNGARLTALWPGAALFTESVTGNGIITIANVNTLTAFIPLAVLYGCIFLCFLCLYLALGHTAKALGAIGLFGLGLLSRMAMGFSPTIWTSGPRTSLFWQMATIGIAALLYSEVANGAKRWQKTLFWCIFGLFCLVGLYSIQEMRIATGYSNLS